MLSSSFGIITDHAINATGHGYNVVDGLNETQKSYLKEKWNLLVNEQVMTHQGLKFFQVLQKTPNLNFQINAYTFSIKKKY